MHNAWTHERIRALGKVLGLAEDEWDEIEGFLLLDQIESARLAILEILDGRLAKKEISEAVASSLYLAIGYSPLELAIIRRSTYDPRTGIRHPANSNKADG